MTFPSLFARALVPAAAAALAAPVAAQTGAELKQVEAHLAASQSLTANFVQTDSKAANVVLRVLGPTAPKLAQDAADQLVLFFTGVARYVHAHPERADELLGPAAPARRQ